VKKQQSLTKLLILKIVVLLLLTIAAGPVFGKSQKVRVFVEFSPGEKTAVQRILNSAGAEFHYTFDHLNSFAVSLPEQALKGIEKNPNVIKIEEDVPRYLIMNTSNQNALVPLADTVADSGDIVPYGVDAVQARDVWDGDYDGNINTGSPAGVGKKVCIIDTGYYGDHEDLPDLTGNDGTSQVDNNWYEDGYGHGSHVAGTIVGEANGLGVIGVAPNASLYIVKFFNNDGNATYASDLIAASNTCADNDANIISMSLGGPRPSNIERKNFDALYNQGVLSVAAAGNAGTTAYSYPASYNSVISVAAVDETNEIADFSQQNSQVELAAPGVGVLSTVPFTDINKVTVLGTPYAAYHIEFSARGSVSNELVDGGLCTDTGPWGGKIVLCERGDISFYDKIINVQNSGGAGALIYNNEPGNFLGTLGTGNISTIIGLSISQEDGQSLIVTQLGNTANITSEYTWPASGYESWSGTSMATPHVSAVAALLWSEAPDATNAEIREAMNATALDLGADGRDITFGFGLVQAKNALDYLFGNSTNTAPAVSITAPSDGTIVETGNELTFTGTATDVEDGDISSSIVWTSDKDGELGGGASVAAILSEGTHTITASATDSGNFLGTDRVTVTVINENIGEKLIVYTSTNKESYVDREWVYITAKVTDENGTQVVNASIDVTLRTANQTVKTFTGLTDTAGQAQFTYKTFIRKDGSGTYTIDTTASAIDYLDSNVTTVQFTVN